MMELPHITQCPRCSAKRKTGKGMYFHLINKHGLKMNMAYDTVYHGQTMLGVKRRHLR
jgi:hypothetical protein